MKRHQEQKRTILGVTLTKRGWNNVVIYAVLIMMFTFYFMGSDEGSEESFRPFAVYNIVELRDRTHDLVRVGNQWEMREGQLTSSEQSRWLDAWQNLTLKPYGGLLAGDEYAVEVSVADQNGSMRIVVFYQPDKVLVALPGYDQVFKATHEAARDLRPAR
ncbi:MAG: hypothetical protein M1473_00405 [Firmicutes bacterium]|nr:hypothetical protein [Bacillota bacterium]